VFNLLGSEKLRWLYSQVGESWGSMLLIGSEDGGTGLEYPGWERERLRYVAAVR
jgi:hypothetical protein